MTKQKNSEKCDEKLDVNGEPVLQTSGKSIEAIIPKNRNINADIKKYGFLLCDNKNGVKKVTKRK